MREPLAPATDTDVYLAAVLTELRELRQVVERLIELAEEAAKKSKQ